MNTKLRIEKAKDVYNALQEIRSELDSKNGPLMTSKLTTLRAKMACLEHQLATIRLLQAEDRLTQFIYKSLFVIAGAIITTAFTILLK